MRLWSVKLWRESGQNITNRIIIPRFDGAGRGVVPSHEGDSGADHAEGSKEDRKLRKRPRHIKAEEGERDDPKNQKDRERENP